MPEAMTKERLTVLRATAKASTKHAALAIAARNSAIKEACDEIERLWAEREAGECVICFESATRGCLTCPEKWCSSCLITRTCACEADPLRD